MIAEAREAMAVLLASDHGDKSIAASVRRHVREEDREHWRQALRLTGMPET